jgi:cullin 3
MHVGSSREKKFKIHPFKRPPRRETPHETWATLKVALLDVSFNRQSQSLSFQSLYSKAHDLVVDDEVDLLYNGICVDVIEKRLESMIAELAPCNDEEITSRVLDSWRGYQTSMRVVREITYYLENYLTSSSLQVGSRLSIHDASFEAFRKLIVCRDNIGLRARDVCLERMASDRSSISVDKAMLKEFCEMIYDLGLGSDTFYVDVLEKPFLAASREFFRHFSSSLLIDASLSDYLKGIDTLQLDEKVRCEGYLRESTWKQVSASLNDICLVRCAESLLQSSNANGLPSFIEHEEWEDISRVYRLFACEESTLQLLREALVQYCSQVGQTLVGTHSQPPSNSSSSEPDPIAFIQGLIDFETRCEKIIEACQKDEKLSDMYRGVYERVINLNSRASEHLSMFLDDYMRKGVKGNHYEVTETVLNDVMGIFRWIRDKDLFESYYKQHLSRRLLSGRRINNDAEHLVISKLKSHCGYVFTSKLEGMFNDMRLSNETMSSYEASPERKERSRESGNIDLAVLVLTTGVWPLSTPPSPMRPTHEMQTAMESFSSFYLSHHTGRRLVFHLNLGSVTLRARFGTTSCHDLILSPLLALVLLHFNGRDQSDLPTIAKAVNVDGSELETALLSLSVGKFRLLQKGSSGKTISATETFSINHDFKNAQVRLRIPTIMLERKDMSNEEQAETLQRAAEDRRIEVDAALVRMMKAKKSMHHNDLVAEVTALLQARFIPDPLLIKKRIESLIDREYLEREDEDQKRYRYLA